MIKDEAIAIEARDFALDLIGYHPNHGEIR